MQVTEMPSWKWKDPDHSLHSRSLTDGRKMGPGDAQRCLEMQESDKQPLLSLLCPAHSSPWFCGFCKYFSRLSQSTQWVVWLNGRRAQKKGNMEVGSVAWGSILMSPNSDPSWCKISVQLFPVSILKSFTQQSRIRNHGHK